MSEHSSNGVFTDQDPVDPNWAAPDPTAVDTGWLPPEPLETTDESKRRSRLLTVGVPMLAGILVIGLVIGFGGFRDRTDTLIDVAAGDVIEAGPYEFVFTEATAKREKQYDDKIIWEVQAVGQAHNTGTVTISPDANGDSGMFVARDPVTREVQVSTTSDVGEAEGFMVSTTKLTPSLPPVTFKVSFEFTDKYEPSETILFGVNKIEFASRDIIGDEKRWGNGSYIYRMDLPVTVLPEDLD